MADRGAACDGDHTVVGLDGTRVDCGAYRCEGSTCKITCTRNSDCTGAGDCATDGRCVSSDGGSGSGPDVSEEGGCSMHASPTPTSRNVLLTFVMCAACAVLQRRAHKVRALTER